MHVVRGRSLRLTRWCARAPRIAFITATLLLAAAGLRGALASGPDVLAPPVAARGDDTEADTLAEAFVREYLTWDGSRPKDQVVGFGATVDGPAVPIGIRQRVRWTAVAGIERRRSRRVITVVALTTHGTYHVAVTVGRFGRGLLAVTRPPAIVGGLPVAARSEPVEREVVDPALSAVLRRAMHNYLARDRIDLLADLDRDAVVVLPDQPLRLRRADTVTWVQPHRRAALAVRGTTRAGVELSLRYELAVVRRGGRWLVQSIQTDAPGGDS